MHIKILSVSCGVGILPALMMQVKCRLAYQALDGKWVSQPCHTIQRVHWVTEEQAIAALLAP